MNTSLSLGKRRFLHVEVRHIPALQSIVWLRRGWEDLRQMEGSSLAHGVIISVIGAVLLMLGSTHPYLIAAAVTGYLLVGPIMTTGVCELSRRRAAREPRGFDESLEAVTRNPDALMQFGGILALIAIVWFIASTVLLQSIFGIHVPSLAIALWGGAGDFASTREVIGYFSSGALFAVTVFVLSVVAVPLIIDRHATAAEAMWASVKACLHNIPAMIVWAALIVALTALGFVTLLLGMIVIAPLLGHATWHAYRDLVG
ncbi:MAG TPA: DUF2189 domain-containing protein [Steroidobacteraceae bacterium]|jgi:uncharacterized membrane protein|nr:DUF2189 domain-containing protein [Steroidobacteraceae bacterium]